MTDQTKPNTQVTREYHCPADRAQWLSNNIDTPLGIVSGSGLSVSVEATETNSALDEMEAAYLAHFGEHLKRSAMVSCPTRYTWILLEELVSQTNGVALKLNFRNDRVRVFGDAVRVGEVDKRYFSLAQELHQRLIAATKVLAIEVATD